MKYIAYYRVSSVKQGDSGLGLEAQKSGMINHYKGEEPTYEFTDVVSGNRKKLHKRKNIHEAMNLAAKLDLPLVVYKLDRFGRDVELLGKLLNMGVHFVALDFPATHADKATNRMVLTIMMAVAEYESERGSIRTKDALNSLKKKGIKLGTPREFKKEEYMSGAIATAKKHWTPQKDVIYKMANEFKNLGIPDKIICDKLNGMGFGVYDSRKLNRLFYSAELIQTNI
jgi:DNA invertase Pin-like site-specific DNA recombinase